MSTWIGVYHIEPKGAGFPRVVCFRDRLVSFLRNHSIMINGHRHLISLDDHPTAATYANNKEAVREFAIAWQGYAGNAAMSYGELADWQCLFEQLGRRYGLLTEFRENAIC